MSIKTNHTNILSKSDLLEFHQTAPFIPLS